MTPPHSAALPLLLILTLAGCGGSSSTLVSPPLAKPQIAYQGPGIPGSNYVQELFTANHDGTHVTQITHDGLNEFLPHFSPDGAHLLYSKFLTGQYGDPTPQTDIFSYSFASASETRLTVLGTAFQAAWSPNGRQIAFGTYEGTALYIANADGSNLQLIAHPTGALDDLRWDDFAWSSDDWIVFTVAQNINNCFKVRIDKMRPDGSARTQVTGGGPSCTPPGMEQYGDADPGISADGQTIFSSRGIGPQPGFPTRTLRHLYAFSSDAYTPGKPEADLSLSTYPDCVVGVPKGSPDGSQILVFLSCHSDPQHAGITLTNTAGSSWSFVLPGFGADWNPTSTQ